jgi:hypothetical protein
MEQHEKDMQLIALISGELGDFTSVECSEEEVEHFCKGRNNERMLLHLHDVEFFKEGRLKEVKAEFCEYCNQVFIYKPE